jgi:predicted nucleic acid-binding protein
MVVDSSVWIEILQHGSLHDKCLKAIHRQTVRVPTVILFEVYRKLKSKVSEDVALEAVAALGRYEAVELTREIALLAGDLSLEHDLAMADALVLASAHYFGDVLLTLDNDFLNLPSARVIR